MDTGCGAGWPGRACTTGAGTSSSSSSSSSSSAERPSPHVSIRAPELQPRQVRSPGCALHTLTRAGAARGSAAAALPHHSPARGKPPGAALLPCAGEPARTVVLVVLVIVLVVLAALPEPRARLRSRPPLGQPLVDRGEPRVHLRGRGPGQRIVLVLLHILFLVLVVLVVVLVVPPVLLRRVRRVTPPHAVYAACVAAPRTAAQRVNMHARITSPGMRLDAGAPARWASRGDSPLGAASAVRGSVLRERGRAVSVWGGGRGGRSERAAGRARPCRRRCAS
jgi:hypothetical protein